MKHAEVKVGVYEFSASLTHDPMSHSLERLTFGLPPH